MDSLNRPVEPRVAAIVLAAGQSKRMGTPKLVLPWGNSTVIRHVIHVLIEAALDEILVVTGGACHEVEMALEGMAVRFVYNPEYMTGEMLSSLRMGLQSLGSEITAALVVLGDQPQIHSSIVQKILSTYLLHQSRLVVPSYSQRRGHPWLVERSLWQVIFALQQGQTLRDFLNAYEEEIEYVLVDSEAILYDLDTPQDYSRFRTEW